MSVDDFAINGYLVSVDDQIVAWRDLEELTEIYAANQTKIRFIRLPDTPALQGEST